MKGIQVLFPNRDYWLRIIDYSDLEVIKDEDAVVLKKVMNYVKSSMKQYCDPPYFFIRGEHVFNNKNYSSIDFVVGLDDGHLETVVKDFRENTFRNNGLSDFVFSELGAANNWIKVKGLFKKEYGSSKLHVVSDIFLNFTEGSIIENKFY